MCYKRQYMCIKLEAGTMFSAIIIAICTNLAVVTSVVVLLLVNEVIPGGDQFSFGRYQLDVYNHRSALNIVFGILAVKFFIDFLFAVLLCIGMCKKKMSYLKAYLIYGAMMAALGAPVVFLAFWEKMECARFLLAFLLLYGLILHMVKLSHDNLLIEKARRSEKKCLIQTICKSDNQINSDKLIVQLIKPIP